MPTSRILLAWVLRTSIFRNAPSISPTRKFAVVVFSSVSLSSRSCSSVSAVVCRSQYSSTPSGRTLTPTARRSFLCSMILQRLLSWSKFFWNADLLAHHRFWRRRLQAGHSHADSGDATVSNYHLRRLPCQIFWPPPSTNR